MSLKKDREAAAYHLETTDGLGNSDYVEAIREQQKRAMQALLESMGIPETEPNKFPQPISCWTPDNLNALLDGDE